MSLKAHLHGSGQRTVCGLYVPVDAWYWKLTDDVAEVTCQRCLNSRKAQEELTRLFRAAMGACQERT